MEYHQPTSDEAERMRLFALTEEIAHVGHWYWNVADGRLFWSDEAHRIHGADPAQFFPSLESAIAAFHPDDRVTVLQQLTGSLHTREPFDLDARLIRSDGTERSIVLRGRPEFDADGRVAAVLVVLQDVTNLRWAEDRYRDEAPESDRPSDPDPAADPSDVANADLLATVSHEIRAALNNMLGMSELLLDGDLTDRQRQFTRTVRDSGQSLLDSLGGIVEFSAMEAAEPALDEQDFDLLATIDGAVEWLAPRADKKGLDIPAVVAADVPTALHGDAGRLRQILLNLLSNAIKFTEAGGVTLSVETTGDETAAGETVPRFEVSDTGVGTTAELRRNLFDGPAQRGTPETTPKGGTGLGLAVCRHLVTRMGGRIGVEDNVGQGSRFWFTVPFRRQAEGNDAPWTRPLSTLIGRRAVVGDGNAENRAAVVRQLEAIGMEVSSAGDPGEVLGTLMAAAKVDAPIDLLILDQAMLAADGGALAEQLNRNGDLANPRPIVMAAPDAAKESGTRVLVKPFRPSGLLTCLTRLAAENTTPAPADQPKQRRPILVVEDNDIERRLAATVLEHAGYEAVTLSDGHAALTALADRDYDVVLIDLNMPDIDGFETARRIRRLDHARANVPIIAMTENVVANIRERCLHAGMNDCISKPVDKTELCKKVDVWASLDRAANETRLSGAFPDRTVDDRVLDRLRAGTANGRLDLS